VNFFCFEGGGIVKERENFDFFLGKKKRKKKREQVFFFLSQLNIFPFSFAVLVLLPNSWPP